MQMIGLMLGNYTNKQNKKGKNMTTLNETKIVYAIYDNKGNFFQYIKVSELCGAIRHFLKIDKKVTIEEDFISKERYKILFN